VKREKRQASEEATRKESRDKTAVPRFVTSAALLLFLFPIGPLLRPRRRCALTARSSPEVAAHRSRGFSFFFYSFFRGVYVLFLGVQITSNCCCGMRGAADRGGAVSSLLRKRGGRDVQGAEPRGVAGALRARRRRRGRGGRPLRHPRQARPRRAAAALEGEYSIVQCSSAPPSPTAI
jgi:hypothetical protein